MDVSGESNESVDLRLRRVRAGVEELEVAAFVGLRRFHAEELRVAARVAILRWTPGLFSAGQLFVADAQVDLARLDVQLDQISVADECDRAADGAFGGDVEDAGA